MLDDNKEYIKQYFQGKDLGVNISYQGQTHYFPSESLLEATLASPPEVHKFVVQKLKTGSKKSVKHLMESIAETLLKENA